MYKLFAADLCPYCHRAFIVAAEKKVAYEKVSIPLGDAMPDWYKKLNPNESVPTLTAGEDNKKVFFESNLIAQYLDSVGSPSGSLMGSTPYQRHRVDFFLSEVGDLIGAFYGVLRDPFNAEKRKSLDDNIQYLEGIIGDTQKKGPFYLDDAFSMADVALLPFLIRMKSVLAYYAGYDIFAKAPRMKALWEAGKDRPSVAADTTTPEEYIRFYLKFVPNSLPIHASSGKPVLYGSKFCPFVDRARLACALKKYDVFYIEVPLHPEAEWLKYVNPRETVPVLVTPQGEPVHESQLVAHYIDTVTNTGRPLLPLDDAEAEYKVRYFITNVGYFVGGMFGYISNTDSKEAKEEFVWAAQQLEKLLAEEPFGPGPFFGGQQMNAGDVALLPMLVRAKVYAPERTAGFEILADFPRLNQLLEAGSATEEAKSVFLDKETYVAEWDRIVKQHH